MSQRALRRMGTFFGRTLAALGLVLLLLASFVWARSYWLPLPEALLRTESPGPRVLDRHGELLGRLRSDGGMWSRPLGSADIGPHTFAVLLAAEDARFWSHPGVDPLAMARATLQAIAHGRIVSGASTITQQLARSCFERPRNLWGKLQEMSLALRIERSLSKEQILLSYLNRVHFGPQVLGMGAASERYFGKPIGALDLGETALLVATVRGPTVYDLDRHLARARQRRDVILVRAREHGLASAEDVRLALGTPAVQRPYLPWAGAWHWTRRVVRERPGQTEIHSTVDLALERRVEELARRRQRELEPSGVSALAMVVMDTASAEVLAYVGSHDPRAERALGQNDGATSLRQPGSALKPLLYAAAVDQLGLGPDSILPDEPLTFRTPTGHYTPDNYDRRFRGPVTLSRALSSSLNVPAVFALERLGVARGLTTLRAFGLTSLDRGADHYGLGLVLGAGEVTLLDLTAAYAALGRGGIHQSPRLTLDQEPGTSVQVVSPRAARVITEILRDERARSEMFGPSGVAPLDPSAKFALKTGTSSGFRDAWAFVYDERVTVGVWVGNFDGRPMVETSGALGAAPLAVAAWLAARKPPAEGPLAGPRSPSTPGDEAAQALIWSSTPRITFPADGARLSPRAPAREAEVVVRAVHAPEGARLVVDDRSAAWTPGTRGGLAIISAELGVHRARLIDAHGATLSSVTFHVVPQSGPGLQNNLPPFDPSATKTHEPG